MTEFRNNRLNDTPFQEFRTSPRGLYNLVLAEVVPGFSTMEARAKERESQRLYQVLPDASRVHLGRMSKMLRHRPTAAITPRELALVRLAWEFAFQHAEVIRPPTAPISLPSCPGMRLVRVPSQLVPTNLSAYMVLITGEGKRKNSKDRVFRRSAPLTLTVA